MDLRFWLSPRGSIELGVGVLSALFWQSGGGGIEERYSPPDTWRGSLSVTSTHTFAETVTLSAGTAFSQNLLVNGVLTSSSDLLAPSIAFGSVGEIGYRSIPLVRIHFTDVFSLDGHSAVGYGFASRSVTESSRGKFRCSPIRWQAR